MATTYSSPSSKTGLFRRGPVGLLVIAAHVVLIYFVAASLGIVEIPHIAKPMEAVIIDSPDTQKSEPVKVIKPEFEQPQIQTPLTNGFARTGYELGVIEAREQKMNFGRAEAAAHAELTPAK